MKPSFAEYMENELLKDPYLQYIPYFAELLPKGGTKRDQRVERVKRLENWEMQIRYLTLFTIFTKRKYKNYPTTKAQLMWFASVYNTGLQHTQEKIQKNVYSGPLSRFLIQKIPLQRTLLLVLHAGKFFR
ncbi:MAG: hypothetical protein LIP01_06015 [Tannerellaceae bacterium]|nr:hypothetical protein [Tannerellaceae bacterium]